MASIAIAAIASTGLLSLPVIYRESFMLHPIKGNAEINRFSFVNEYSLKSISVPYHPSSQVHKLEPHPQVYLSACLVRPEKSEFILFCAGNAGNKRYHAMMVERLLEVFPNHGFMLFDYEGYGDSYGKSASLKGLFESTLTMYRYMKRNVLASSAQGLTVFGQSVGSGAACSILPYMQSNDRLILQNGFSSLRDMMEHWVPAPFSWIYGEFLDKDFNNIVQIYHCNEAQVPILAMHCVADGIVPYAIGRRLGSLSQVFLPLKGTHNEPIYEEKDEWALRRFVKEIRE